MKKISSFITLFLTSILSFSQCISLNNGSTLYAIPPSLSASGSGNLQGFSTNTYVYYYSISFSGSFTQIPTQILVNGTNWNPGVNDLRFLKSGNNSFFITATLPSNSAIGDIVEITIKIYQRVNNTTTNFVCENRFYVSKLNPKISGNIDMCINTNSVYTINSPIQLSGNNTWTTTNGWKINGNNSPYTTAATSVTLTAPSTIGNTNLCVSNSIMWQQACYNVYAVTSPQSLTSVSATVPCCESICRSQNIDLRAYPMTILPGLKYIWTMPQSYTSLIPDTSVQVNNIGNNLVTVKRQNACGTSNTISTTYYSYGINSPQCRNGFKRMTHLTDEDVTIYPNPSNGQVTFLFFSEDDLSESELIIYSTDGAVVFSKKIESTSMDLDLSNFSSGIYMSIVKNKEGDFKQTNDYYQIIKSIVAENDKC